MAKLHEVLAVKTNLEGQAEMALGNQKELYAKKRHHFGCAIRQFTPLAEGSQTQIEEQSDIQTTIAKELEWFAKIFAKHVDNTYQIDEANTKARADVILDSGDCILKDVPATTLLQLESQIVKVQELLNAVPTLDPAKGFTPDENRGKGYFKARDVQENRTKKVKQRIVMYDATKEHPAQVQMVDVDEVSGKILKQEWSSLITPAVKSEMLERCDELLRAVRRARSRANDIEVSTDLKIGMRLLRHVFGSDVIA